MSNDVEYAPALKYVIIEYNGPDYITLVLDNYGEVKKFNSQSEAESYVAEYIAFKYKVVGLCV